MAELKIASPAEPAAVRLEEEVEAPDEGFTSVRISELYSPRKVAFDLFLRLGAGRYLRVFRAGENFEEAELKAYEADRGMRYVFFAREHRAPYVASSLTLLQKITPLAAVPLRTKFGVARILSELYVDMVMEAAENALPDLVVKGKEIATAIAAWIDAQPGLERHLLLLEQVDALVAPQAFLTALFSCVLANRMPWKSRRTNESLLLANFLADVGQSVLPPEVKRLKPKRMNGQQKRQYEKHPEASFVILSELGAEGLNQNELTIVREHHEYSDGSGYPRGLTGDKTLMLSKLVVLCGDLVRTASDFLLPPNEAAKVLFPDFTEKLFKEHPDLAAKYEKELLAPLFRMITKEGGP